MNGWIGVDLDGTLAHWGGWDGGAIGAPIPAMVQRVKQWIAQGQQVRIMTARVGGGGDTTHQQQIIRQWCLQNLGRVLPVTACKDHSMVELWDDRAVGVIHNTGQRADGKG